MLRSVRQTAINSICSHFVFFQIHSTHDLLTHLNKIIRRINQDPTIFRPTDTSVQRTEIFAAAIAAYAHVTEYNINVLPHIDWNLSKESKGDTPYKHSDILSRHVSPSGSKDTAEHDLSRVTHCYDQFVDAIQTNKETSQAISTVLERKNYGVCDSIILGAGDTGTTLWLEKYKSQHKATYRALSERKLPTVLMIADGFGGWKNDYTLAQTHSSLERNTVHTNPGDFLPTQFYQRNPQTNARHVFQANHICLSNTQAPILHTNVLKVEKRENHSKWQDAKHPYRLIVQFPNGQIKAIYTHNIEIGTGLGAPNVDFDAKVVSPAELKKLSTFDQKLGFTPMVDGNQFALANVEEEKEGRTVVIYGGGGTASACYRRSFFGTDFRTYDLPYTPQYQKNSVTWVFKNFIGTGKMADNALSAARNRKEVFEGELVKATQRSDKKLLLEFKTSGSGASRSFLCDQLVYSIGQNDIRTKEMCSEVSDQLVFRYDPSGMPLYFATPDNRVNFFGAAAITVRKTEFNNETMKWLEAQNIGGDVGAGSMPPTRAQIKRHLDVHLGVKAESINANMDTNHLMEAFFSDAKVDRAVTTPFINDLLLARKDDTYGCSRDKLGQLLKKHQLDNVFDIFGHSHLVLKGRPLSVQPMSLPVPSLSLHTTRVVGNNAAAKAGEKDHKTAHPLGHYSLAFFPVVDPNATAFVSSVGAGADAANAADSQAAGPAVVVAAAVKVA